MRKQFALKLFSEVYVVATAALHKAPVHVLGAPRQLPDDDLGKAAQDSSSA